MLSVGGSIMWTVLCLVQHIEEKISSKFYIYRKKLYILYKNYILPILDLFLLYILTLVFFFYYDSTSLQVPISALIPILYQCRLCYGNKHTYFSALKQQSLFFTHATL